MSDENQPTDSLAAPTDSNIRRPASTLSVASLRRTSPLHTPTRTLRLTEAEHLARNAGPPPVTLASLASRPRSNPRSRTPMRYESPLNPDEFRREPLTTAAEQQEQSSTPEGGSRRIITIRPSAGLAVGSIAATRIDEKRATATKSRKQGPSHRKVRRWNNDHFVGLATEIAKSSREGHIAAEVLLRAHDDAHLYRDVYDPSEHRSDQMNR